MNCGNEVFYFPVIENETASLQPCGARDDVTLDLSHTEPLKKPMLTMTLRFRAYLMHIRLFSFFSWFDSMYPLVGAKNEMHFWHQLGGF